MTLRARIARRLGGLDLDVDLTVADGEIVAVLGPNGAGKTTLLRCLAGLERVGEGRVELGEATLEDTASGVRASPGERDVGVVFQEHILFPHLSALDNVAFGPRSRGASKAHARHVAAGWLARLGLDDRAAARPESLSGGQSQRVALARALAVEPRLLLLDEPMAALDAEARQSVRRALRAHLGAFEGPCLLVTHEPLEAIALADRLVILEHGRVTQDGAATEVARHPRSQWVAGLVGLNLYAGRAHGHEIALDAGGTLVSHASAHGDAYAVVHPRAVALHQEAPEGSPRNVWPGTVDGIDLHGDDVRIHLDGPTPVVAQVTPAALAELGVTEGQRLWASVKATEVDLYLR